MFGCNGDFMWTFSGNQLWVCRLSDSQWIRQTGANGQFPNPFPGAMPVNSFSSRSDMNDVIIVVAGDGVLWQCGIPAGDWEMFAPQPPADIVFKQFLGGSWYPNNNDWYIAFLDTAGVVWMIGNPASGGEWVAPQNLVPQSDWGPFGYNTGPNMWAFSGNTLQVCAIDVVGRWIPAPGAQPFTGTFPLQAMYGYRAGIVVIDGAGFISRVEFGSDWLTDIPQHRTLIDFIGASGSSYYIAGQSMDGEGWLYDPNSGPDWVSPQGFTPP